MPFPASNGSIPLTLDAAWALARSTAQQVQQQAVALNAQISAGPVSAQAIVNSCSFFATLNATLTQCAAVSGLAAYAQTQVGNPGLDVAGAFSGMQAALVAVGSWIMTNFPKDAASYLAYVKFNGAGQPVYDAFTQAALAPLAALLTALSATIN